MAAKKKSVKKTSKSKAKKTVKKKTTKKAVKKLPKKKTVKKAAPLRTQSRRIKATPGRISLVLRNLILFIVITLISYILYLVSNNFVYDSFFYLLSMVAGFISLAFLISLVVFLFLKIMRK
jgi:Flp pilus assembly protein TadB